MEAKLYNMKIGDRIEDNDLDIVRVPGGWLYIKVGTFGCFVPEIETAQTPLQYRTCKNCGCSVQMYD